MAISERRRRWKMHQRERRLRRLQRYTPAFLLAAVGALLLILILTSGANMDAVLADLMERGRR